MPVCDIWSEDIVISSEQFVCGLKFWEKKTQRRNYFRRMEKVDGKWHKFFFFIAFFLVIGRHFPWNLLNDSKYWRMIKRQQRNLHPCSDSSFTAHVKDGGDNEKRNRFPLDCERVCFAWDLGILQLMTQRRVLGLVTYRGRYKLILNTWRGKLAFEWLR